MEASALRHPTRAPALTGRSSLLRLQSDEKLIAFIRRGHQGAFEVLVQRYTSRLQAFCRHMLGSNEDAEDVLQEVFASAFNAICADERPINARPWLYRIARNRCLNHLRRPTPAGQDSMDVFERDGGTTTADTVHKREEFRHIVSDVQALPETQRTALLLREMDALSYEQISEAMDTTVPSVKSLLVRARVSLAEAGEARLLTCDDVRLELGEVAEGLRRSSAPARRHVRGCERCRNFKCELARANKALAAVYPVGVVVVLHKLIAVKFGIGLAAGHGAAAGGSAGLAGGAAAGSGALAAGGGAAAAAGTGALTGGGAIASVAAAGSASAAAGSVAAVGAGGGVASAAAGALSAGVGTLAGKAAAGLAAAAIVTAGAVEVDHVARDADRGSAVTPALSEPAPRVSTERLPLAEPPRAKTVEKRTIEATPKTVTPAVEAPAQVAKPAEPVAADRAAAEAKAVGDPALEPPAPAAPAAEAITTPAPGASASPPVPPAPSIDSTTGGTAASSGQGSGQVQATPPAPVAPVAPKHSTPAGETVAAPVDPRPLPVAGETVVPAGQ